MFPTMYRATNSRSLSYPVGAQTLSGAFANVPQARTLLTGRAGYGSLQIAFEEATRALSYKRQYHVSS
jgi:hypothetical protein